MCKAKKLAFRRIDILGDCIVFVRMKAFGQFQLCLHKAARG